MGRWGEGFGGHLSLCRGPHLPMVPTHWPSRGWPFPSRGPRTFERCDLPSEAQPPGTGGLHTQRHPPHRHWTGVVTGPRRAWAQQLSREGRAGGHSSPSPQSLSERQPQGPPSKCLAGTPTPSRAAGAPLPTFARSSGLFVAG